MTCYHGPAITDRISHHPKMAACLCQHTDGDEIREHELAADFKYFKLGDGVDQEKAIATSSTLRSESPIPNSASRWKRCHAEKLNIYCVPIHKSQYMHPVGVDDVMDAVHQKIQMSASGFSSATDRKLRSKRSTSCTSRPRSKSTGEQQKSSHSASRSQKQQAESESALPCPLELTAESLQLTPLQLPTPAVEMHIKENKGFSRDRVHYEYDYKSLLRDMIKPNRDPDKCDKWWAKFEHEVVRRYNIMEIVDRNLTQPDIDEEMSLAFSDSFMVRSSANANAAECKDPSKKMLEDLLKNVQGEEDRVKLLRQNTLADQSMDTRTPVSKAFDFLDFRL
ncbi:uncharacterized protein LOC135503568 [Lineus longissimus]